MPLAVIGGRLFTPSHSCGRHACSCRARTRIPVETAGGLMADLDDPRLAALATDRDLPAPQVNITAQRVIRVVADPGQLRQPDAARREHGDDRAVAALGERPAL